MTEERTSKYKAFREMTGLPREEVKAMLYLRYGKDPAKMGYEEIDDEARFLAMFSPATALEVAKAISTDICDTRKALVECAKRGEVSRRRVPNDGKPGPLPYAYFLDKQQGESLRELEYTVKNAVNNCRSG
jgi:hypothetical protein